MTSSSPASRGPGCLGRSVLPDVLADGQGDVNAADLDHLRLVAGNEVTELVEDAVVRQVVLVVPRDDAAVGDHRRGVGREVLRQSQALWCGAGERVEVADDHHKIAQALVLEAGGEFGYADTGRLDERRAERQVLDRVTVDDHLRHRDHMRAALGCGPT